MRIELTGGISEVWRGREGRIPAITIVLVQRSTINDKPGILDRRNILRSFQNGKYKSLVSFFRTSE